MAVLLLLWPWLLAKHWKSADQEMKYYQMARSHALDAVWASLRRLASQGARSSIDSPVPMRHASMRKRKQKKSRGGSGLYLLVRDRIKR